MILTNVQATVSRAAISAALHDLGYLTTRASSYVNRFPHARASDISQ